jgi:predicted phosphodiesterase
MDPRRPLLSTLLLTGLTWALVSCSGPSVKSAPSEPFESGFVTLGTNGSTVLRHLTHAPQCPKVLLDGREESLILRVGPDERPQFEVKTCELVLPKGARSVSVEGKSLPVPKSEVKRIVILGDTGCRVKGKTSEKSWIQDCLNPEAWPFARIAASAAALRPDLVIHTGDYLYRESACPTGAKGCEQFPSGDTFAAWNADFFTPARPLLAVAPWIFVRGNHESCARAGEGFHRLLDPAPFNPVCLDEPEPYLVPFSNLRFAVLDSSLKETTRPRLDRLKPLKLSRDILLTHRPLWSEDTSSPLGPVSGVKLVFTGHWHLFHLSAFDDGRALQIVVGNGGTELIKNPRQTPTGTEIDGTTLRESNLIPVFGFAVLERTGGHWELTARDRDGRVLMKKRIHL